MLPRLHKHAWMDAEIESFREPVRRYIAGELASRKEGWRRQGYIAREGAQPSPFHDSPFYDVCECADGGYVTAGALEPQLYALLLQKLGLHDVDPSAQYDKAAWPALKARLTALFASRPRAHWCELLEGTDVCFAPVLSLAEARAHPHNAARREAVASAGDEQPVVDVAPRFLPLKAG